MHYMNLLKLDEFRIYKVDSGCVVVLDGNVSYEKGNQVMAMFPDTTSFYPATIVV